MPATRQPQRASPSPGEGTSSLQDSGSGQGCHLCSLPPKDQFHRMVELTAVARQAYKTMLESVHQELAGEPGPLVPASPLAQDPGCPVEGGPSAPAGAEKPPHSECWGGCGVTLSVWLNPCRRPRAGLRHLRACFSSSHRAQVGLSHRGALRIVRGWREVVPLCAAAAHLAGLSLAGPHSGH